VPVDTREQNPFDLSRFGWFAEVEKKALTLGDYSIAGLEDVCVVERKNLSDLVRSLTTDRAIFMSRLKKMSAYPHTLLVITAALLGKIVVPILPMQSQPCHAGTHRGAGRLGRAFRVHGKHMSWARRLSLPICIKFTFTTGSNPTDTGDGWRTMICNLRLWSA
jgi:hypothetical protein